MATSGFLDDLVGILRIGPINNDFRCVGHAYSRNRRCLTHINAENRRTSAATLSQLSRFDVLFGDLHDNLEQLLSRLLCIAHHQDQLPDILL